MKILNLKVYYKQFYNEYFDLVHSSCSNNNYYLNYNYYFPFFTFSLCHAKYYISKVNWSWVS